MLDTPSLNRDAAAARQLAQAGRFREAVIIGQAANRRQPDPQLERELRDWRHNAFYEGARGSGRADWPPAMPDPRPDLKNQIPEITVDELSATVLGGALHHHGSLIVRGLLDGAKTKRYANLIDRAFEARDNPERGEDNSSYSLMKAVDAFDPYTRAGIFVAGMTILMVDAPEFMARWLDEIETSGVLGAVSDYLGERPSLSYNKATLYRLPPNPGAQWHQDGAFLGGKSTRTVNLWVALSDCGIDAPGLEVVPWRLDDIVPPGTHGSYFDWAVGNDLVMEMAADKGLSSPVFRAGDAMLFDHLCLHRTAVRPEMTRGRYAIETWMFAPSNYGEGVPLII